MVNPEKIKLGTINLRKDLGDFNELANNIRTRYQQGKEAIIHPIDVIEIEDEIYEYELITGRRRLQSALSIRLPEVPIRILKETDRRELEIMSYLDNAFRKNNNWIEKAKLFKHVHEQGLTYKEIGVGVGLSESRVSRYISTYEKWIGLKLASTQVLEMETTTEIVEKCPEQDIPKLIEYVIENQISSKDVRKILVALKSFYDTLEGLEDYNKVAHDELFKKYNPYRFNPEILSLYEKEKQLRIREVPLQDVYLKTSDYPSEKSAVEYAKEYKGRVIGKTVITVWRLSCLPYTLAELEIKFKKLTK